MAEGRKYHMLINGEMVVGKETFDVINPSTGKPFAQAPHASKADVDAAVDAAYNAFQTWSQVDISERRAALQRALEVFEANRATLTSLLIQEQGKPMSGATAEMEMVARFGLLHNTKLDPPVDVYYETEDARVEVRRVPIGVVVGITPWNFPVFCSVQKWAPAIVLGNTFVLKPSPNTPLTSLYFGELLQKVFPPGVFNVVSGADNRDFNVGAYLASHPKVRKVSFTGSVPTGKKIMASCAEDVKRVTLEMGGNDPAIVRGDCDPVEVAPKLFRGAMANTGQICCAIKRCFVHESIYDQVCAELVKCAANAVVGDGFKEGVEFGPINNAMQFNKVRDIVEDAKKAGANVLCGGEPLPGDGFFYPPTIITGVKEGVRIVDEEQFGPVLPVMPYKDDEEAIQRANNSEYGLGGSVWGKDVDTANKLAAKIRSGTVWVNDHISPTGAPFGGFNQSGLGRELGKADLDTFTECQTFKLAKAK